ncbi:hypothetical protein CGZ77_08935 [Neisseria sp. KEM232]|uniref:hypothetical protein n=1 Tax=Neisseria sp. KEM232 TaxID=655307 RepID=UPI000B8BFC67|nr:hypothetical protein [Neisseria sp. KEM232]ASP17854.1 hypothetical protein CGZ77_08935 [Neisseria sp. KEM232]
MTKGRLNLSDGLTPQNGKGRLKAKHRRRPTKPRFHEKQSIRNRPHPMRADYLFQTACVKMRRYRL